MSEQLPVPAAANTFERIKRVNPEGHEFWSARDFARVLEYINFRNFQPVIEKAKEACVNSGHAVADHFAEMRNMVGIGSGAQREVEDWALSRYACYLVIQNADPSKPLVALGQTYFAVQTRRQELADERSVEGGQNAPAAARRDEKAQQESGGRRPSRRASSSRWITPSSWITAIADFTAGWGCATSMSASGSSPRNTFLTTWAARNWRPIFSAPRRPRKSCAGKMCGTRTSPTGSTAKWGAKSADHSRTGRHHAGKPAGGREHQEGGKPREKAAQGGTKENRGERSGRGNLSNTE